jgi:acyl-CoA thioester hydrolase
MAGQLMFSIPVRVYFQDTDAGGVVFHGTYLDFLERARTEWLRALGFAQRDLARQERILFIVRALEIAYLKPALLDDLLTVTAGIKHLGRAQLTLEQEVLRNQEPLVRASVNLACVDANGMRPAPFPDRIHGALSAAAGMRDERPVMAATLQENCNAL